MKKFFLRWLGFSLFLHLLTAWFSVGYHSADEQFQILEFLSFKLGWAPQTVLAVEFPERMRPWLQPAIYYGLVRFWEFLGIHSSSFWAFSFRAFAGFMGWLSLVGLALASRLWLPVEKHWKMAVKTLCLLWFLPAFHARPSSESLGASAFLIGLSALVLALEPQLLCFSLTPEKTPEKPAPKTPWLIAAGAFLGLSFESRFQMGLMIGGLGAWLIFISPRFHPSLRLWRARIGSVCFLILGFLLVFALGRLADHWGYGDWSFSPWNYFSYNLVRGEVSRYGRAPWWDLLRMSFTESWPFLGTALTLATLLSWAYFPWHLLTWSQIPFFMIHEAIAHKELRFFFPIAAAAPILLALLYSRLENPSQNLFKRIRGLGAFTQLLWFFLLANNGVALGVLAFMPFARTVQFYEAVERELPKEGLRELWAGARDPYEVLGTPIYFYRPKNLLIRRFDTFAQVQARKDGAQAPFWLFQQGFDLPTEARQLKGYCKPIYRTLPHWVVQINYTNWVERSNVWSLYQCGV